MTRAVRRKRIRQSPRFNTPAARWALVGALVASAPAAGASARQLTGRRPLRSDCAAFFGNAIASRLYVADAIQSAQSGEGTSTPRRFDIPPGPLGIVLDALRHATGLSILIPDEAVNAIYSNGVSGVMPIERALDRILAGTSLSFRFTAPGVVSLEFRTSTESVDVTAPAPTTAVSSPKYAVPIKDIPQTIEVIPRVAMEQQGVTTLSEALRTVPGITLQAGEGGGASNTSGDMFNMRGFNAANSLFVDGVRDDGLIARDVFNLEQVEVFMGPTGADVGRGTAAGYVNMETKTPHLPAATSASASLGSAAQRRVTMDVNEPLARADRTAWIAKSALRINALWQDSGVPGRDVVALRSKAFAPSIAFGLDTPTRVTVAGQIVRQDNEPDYGVPIAAWDGDAVSPTVVRASQPVDQANYYGTPAFDYDHAAQTSVLARVEHDIAPQLSLRHQTRYNTAQREAVVTSIANAAAFDPLTNRVTLSRQGNLRENTIASSQTSLTDRFATGRLRHSATAGFEYTFEQQYAPALTGLGVRAPVDIFHPNPDDQVSGYAVARSGASNKGWTNTVALYGFDTMELSERWQVNGGLRWERYDTEYHAIDATGLTTTRERAADALVSGKAGVVFKATPRGNLYASYGATVTPPGAANFTLSAQANNQNNPNVEPQQSRNLEAGAKWDVANGRLSLTGAAFHTINDHVIFTVDATAIPPIYNQDDRQTVNGVSVGASGRVLDRWDVLATFSYLDATADSQNPANDGRRLTLTPARSGSIWTSYRLPRRVTLGGGLRATSEVFVNAANTIKSPGYFLLDALAEYQPIDHLTLRLNVSNLTNATYIRSVNNNGGRYNPGSPRAALVTSTFAF